MATQPRVDPKLSVCHGHAGSTATTCTPKPSPSGAIMFDSSCIANRWEVGWHEDRRPITGFRVRDTSGLIPHAQSGRISW